MTSIAKSYRYDEISIRYATWIIIPTFCAVMLVLSYKGLATEGAFSFYNLLLASFFPLVTIVFVAFGDTATYTVDERGFHFVVYRVYGFHKVEYRVEFTQLKSITLSGGLGQDSNLTQSFLSIDDTYLNAPSRGTEKAWAFYQKALTDLGIVYREEVTGWGWFRTLHFQREPD